MIVQVYARMTGRGDKVEECMNTVVPKAGVTLDTGLFSENIIILAFKIANNFLEATMESGADFPVTFVE